MKLAFTLDAHGTCVGQLKDELLSLEEIATAWKFPFDIFVVAVCRKVMAEKHPDVLIAGIIPSTWISV